MGVFNEQTISGVKFLAIQGTGLGAWKIPDTAFQPRDMFGTHNGTARAYALDGGDKGFLVGREGYSWAKPTMTFTGFLTPEKVFIPFSDRINVPMENDPDDRKNKLLAPKNPKELMEQIQTYVEQGKWLDRIQKDPKVAEAEQKIAEETTISPPSCPTTKAIKACRNR